MSGSPSVIVPMRASTTHHPLPDFVRSCDVRLPGPSPNSRLNEGQVATVVSHRFSNVNEEYLIEWAGRWRPGQTPLSWHSITELLHCLAHIQGYLDRRRGSGTAITTPPVIPARPNLKRKTPDESPHGSSRYPTPDSLPEPLHKVSFKESPVYNAILIRRNGTISVDTSSPLKVNVDSRSFTAEITASQAPMPVKLILEAEKRIRTEIFRRLGTVPGPQITIHNTIDSSSPSLNFQFISESILGDGVTKADLETVLGCTKCRPHMGRNVGCEYSRICECLEYAAVAIGEVDVNFLTPEQLIQYEMLKATGVADDTTGLAKRFPYFRTGLREGCLVPFYLESRNAIYECNQNCSCGPDCTNRVVQRGRKVKLEIFKTSDRGWGLRCPQPLQKGQFIDTYRGEIITDSEASRREQASGPGKESYLYSLDKFAESNGLTQEDCYVVDGEYMGGPTRFINHSCEPNCRQYTVSYNKYDIRIYDIAFFASRDIKAGEELTFDYLDKDDQEEEEQEHEASEEKEGAKPIECHCGANKCRKYLWI